MSSRLAHARQLHAAGSGESNLEKVRAGLADSRKSVAMRYGNREPNALDLLTNDRPLIIGHRGACATKPENTIASFKAALEAGADAVEMDYHHSKDGVPVVIHDEFLDRTTNVSKQRPRIRVRDRTATEICKLDAGSWFDEHCTSERVPLLAAALKFIRDSGGIAVVERKSGDAATCARLLHDFGLVNRAVLISFDWEFLSDLHEMLPEQVLGALGPPESSTKISANDLNPHWLKAIKMTGARVVIWNRNLSETSVELAHKNGFRVWVYTIDAPRTALRLIQEGVDGIITNDPAAMAQVLRPAKAINSAASASRRKGTAR